MFPRRAEVADSSSPAMNPSVRRLIVLFIGIAIVIVLFRSTNRTYGGAEASHSTESSKKATVAASNLPSREIFVDCGANNGNSFINMMKGKFLPDTVVRENVTSYLFELNSAHTKSLVDLDAEYPNIKRVFTNIGLWNETTLLTHHIDTDNVKHNFWGSSVFANHRDGKATETVVVVGMCDFFGTEGITPNDEVTVKLDCEGAELPIMKDIFEHCEEIVDTIWVEYHNFLFTEEELKDNQERADKSSVNVIQYDSPT